MMSFVEDKFIPSGIYNIINDEHCTSIVQSQDDNGRLTSSSNDNFEVSEHVVWFVISGFGPKALGHSGPLPY